MGLSEYRNFDLFLTRDGDRYRAVVIDAPEGEGSVAFELPRSRVGLAPPEGVGGTRLGGATLQQVAPPSAATYGEELFAALFCDDVGAIFAASMAAARRDGVGLRLRLRFDAGAAPLALAPWETLYDPRSGQFMAADERSPVLRYLPLPRSRSALLVEPPLRLLAVLSSPADLPALNTAEQWASVASALAPLTASGKLVLERLGQPSLPALRERLNDPGRGEPVHVLYFMGHGVFDEQQGAGYLAFADPANAANLVRGDELASVLNDRPALRLAYLNACQGALSSNQSVFSGIAQTLVRGGLPACIAMQAEISDAAARSLAESFFAAIAAGLPVDAAVAKARGVLRSLGTDEWAAPVLFSRSPDNRLFDVRDVLPKPDCPYPGMTPFREEQKELFFGREEETRDAIARLRQHPFLAVVGPSGSGKSSLISAGVIPALPEASGFGRGAWNVLTMRPSNQRTREGKAAPLQALAAQLGCPPEQIATRPFDRKTFLFVDQFEELFTQADPNETRGFLQAVGELIGRPNLYILLTVRADFYPDVMGCTLWPQIRANRLELTPLGDDALWAAIVEPAARVGVVVEDALAVQLISDAADQIGVLPLVQETLVLLWDRLERRQLSLQAYRQMADGDRTGLQVAIDRRASRRYDLLDAPAQLITRRFFLRLVQFGEGRADTRRQQTVEELRAQGDDPQLFDATLAEWVQSRLITSSGKEQDPQRRIDIAHEALIRGWSHMQDWLQRRRAAEQMRRRLEEKAADWVRSERRGGLLDEYEAQEAETWLAGSDAQEVGYSRELAGLLAASKVALARQIAEKAEAERSRQRSQLLVKLLGAAALVLVLVSVLAVSALNARREAQINADLASNSAALAGFREQEAIAARATADAAAKQARSAEAETAHLARGIRADQLAVNALRALPQNTLTLALAIEGLRIQDDGGEDVTGSALSNARRAMVGAGVTLSATVQGQANIAGGLEISRDGKRLATADRDGRIVVSSTTVSRTEAVEFRTGDSPALSLVFGPAGSSLLAAADAAGRTTLWDWRRPGQRGRGLEGATYPVVFSGDGARVATASESGDSLIWDVRSPDAAPRRLAAGGAPVAGGGDAAAEWWVTIDRNHNGWRWQGGQRRPLPGAPPSLDFPIASSADGRWFAAVGDRTSVEVWDMAGPTPITLPGRSDTGAIIGLAISPDGRWLLAVRGTQLAQLWRLDQPTDAPVSWSGVLLPMAFSPNSRWLGAASGATSIRIFDLESATATPVELDGLEALTLGFSPEAAQVITVDRNGAVIFHQWWAKDLIAQGCAADGLNLSPRQWMDYLPGIAQRPTCPGWETAPDPPVIFKGRTLAAHRGWFVKLARVTDPISALGDARRYDITVQPAKVQPGQVYWRAVGVYHLVADDNLGLHHVFVDALDEAGLRDRNSRLRIAYGWEGQARDEGPTFANLDQPDDDLAAGNLPLWKGMRVWIEVTGDSLPSDRVVNIHTAWPDEGSGTTVFHHSFYVVYQRKVKPGGQR